MSNQKTIKLRIGFVPLFACGLVLLSLLSHTSAGQSRTYRLPPGKTEADIHSSQLFVRFKGDGYSSNGRTLGSGSDISPSNLGQTIPLKAMRAMDPAANASAGSRKLPSKYLSHLYTVELEDGNVLEAINELLRYDNVFYAEPVFKEELFLIPNDPGAATANTKQPYLSSIKAYDAWGVTTGDSTVIIGVIDTGADYNHEDLGTNIHLNLADPIDGADNDGNGYIDDYRGWDFANRDADPMSDFGSHGTHVAGLSSARTNNATGMAGTGFLSKFVPLKAFKTEDNTSFGNYEAIIYAADRGMDVLNLSWGSTDGYSQAAQDIINYAALEKNMVVVAAAGNTNAELTFYPASYQNVLSVAASTNNGTKASFGTYSYYVDLVAPGDDVYSTRNGNTYGNSAGSSFSAPLVAGAAALLKSYFPHYTSVQVMEQLRITGSSVDELSGNAAYKGLLGRGMLNMFSALTDTLSPSVRIVSKSLRTQTGQKVFYGDTVHLELKAVNWLKPATGLSITFDEVTDFGSISSLAWTVPSLATFDSTQHSLSILVSDSTPPSSRVIVKANMKASGYTDLQYFEFTTQPDSVTLSSASMALTINSSGDLGYTQDSLKAGNGLKFQNVPLVSHAGFLVGTSASSLADNVANNLVYGTRNDGFTVKKHLKQFSGTIADNYYENSFTAKLDDSRTVLVEQKNLSWLAQEEQNYLITEYRVTNTTADTIANLHSGLFTNWNIGSTSNNRTVWVDSLKLGLTYVEQNGYFGGIALLTNQTPTFYAADIASFNGNVAVTDSLLTDSLKFAWLSSNFVKPTAGQSGAGNNTAQMNGVNLGKLPGYKSEKVAFAWVVAESQNEIVVAVQKARAKYAQLQAAPRTIATFFACKNEPATVKLTSGSTFDFYSDAAGMASLIFQGNNYVTDTVTSPTELYVRNADNNYQGDVYAVRIKMDGITGDFTISNDTVLLEPGDEPIVTLTGKDDNAKGWNWDFGNGFQSTLQNPQAKFAAPGTYTVSLTTTSLGGCTASSSQSVLVAMRAPMPDIDTVRVCANTPAIIQAANASKLRVYTDSLSTAPVFEGGIFTTAELAKDTTFYVTNADSLFESKPLLVQVLLNQPNVAFSFAPDTTVLEPAAIFVNETANATSYQWYVDDILISEELNSRLVVGDGSETNIKLVATNEQGCSAALEKLLTFSASPVPVVTDRAVCPGESFRLTPENGQIFLFTDAQTGEPVYKGESYEITAVTDTVRLLVSGVDNITPSAPVEVEVYPFDLSAEFEIDPSVLILKNQKTATFTSLSAGATSWQWTINGELIDISQQPILAFDSAGIYDISLIVGNEAGCADSLSIAYEVLEVTGLDDAEDIFTLFPNPASQSITLQVNQWLSDQATITIFNLAGQEVIKRTWGSVSEDQRLEINIGFLPEGVYTTRVSSGPHTWQQRFIKR